MAGIQLSGLASGLDTQTIISQLMTVERVPRTQITLDQAAATKRQSLLTDLGTKVTALKLAADDLKSMATWADTQSVSTSDDSKVGAVRTAGAAPGGYAVRVASLATAERQTFTFAAPTADGSLTIFEADGTTPRATIPLKAGATVDDAAAAINSTSGAKLFAVNVNGSLVLASRTTGTPSAFQASGAGLTAQTERIPGANADIFVNDVESHPTTNVVTDAIPGVTLTLKSRTSGTDSVGINVSGPGPDQDAIVAKVQAFVDSYNTVVTAARGALGEKRVPNATTSGDAQKGTLFGDSGLSSMLDAMRTSVGSTIPGLTGLSSLSAIGVSTGAAAGTTLNADAIAGKLSFDPAKLRAALTADPLAVRKLLGGQTGTDGVAQAFNAVLAPYQGTTGILASRVTSAGSELSRLSSKLLQFDARMDSKQALLQKQFTALEQAMQQSQSVGNSLTGYINSLSNG
jgi:flagellar hook-associated protein 2